MTTDIRLGDKAVVPLRTLDPAGPLDDLEWLDEAIGDARVVAIGESAHYNGEFYRLRHRLLRYLVERHGFGAYAMETGFVEGRLADDWVRGGGDALGHVQANGLTSLTGMWTELGDHLTWMRERNLTANRPVGFYGIDTPGSNASLLTGLDAVSGYLAQADPEFVVDPGIRETAASFAASSAFAIPTTFAAYGQLPVETRDALTAGLADLAARVKARRLEYVERTTVDAYERASRWLGTTVALDAVFREQVRGSQQGMMLNREVTIADTVEWVLRREDRIVLAAHNGHLQRSPGTLPGMPPTTTLGLHLADRLGEDYLVIGTTSGTGWTLSTEFFAGRLFEEMGPPRPDSLDGLMAASHDGLFAADLRTLSPADVRTVRGVTEQRFGTFYAGVSPLDAYDVLVHVPHVTPGDPDPAALEHAPQDVREAFARWRAEFPVG